MNFSPFIFCMLMLTACAFLPLNAMKPTGIRKIYRSCEKLSARILRPNDVPVFMNDAKTITLAPGATKSVTISTGGLIGCIATILYAQDKKQHKHVLLTHFAPHYHKEHLIELEHHAKILQAHMKEWNLMKFIVVTPCCDYADNKNDHDASYNTKHKELQSVINSLYYPTTIPMLHASYELPPMGKGYTTEVHATVSNNSEHSVCVIKNWALDQTFVLEKTINNL